MPEAKVGEKTSLDRKEFLELKSKGDKVKIRIASANYYYEGKHFVKQSDDSWDVTSCSRVNEEFDCELCEQYFAIKREVKKATDSKEEEAAKNLDKEARKVKPNISFYYPVLDRETHIAAIFRTTLMVRLALEEKVDEGIDILNVDWVVKRTEKPGSYYSLSRVDSADTPELTKDEKAEIKKAKKMNVGEIVGGKKGTMDFDKSDKLDDDIEKALDESGVLN